MSSTIEKCYFHIDLDAFFASVEQLVHPEYRGKPVIVCGDPHHKRNVVSTASYEARKYGVHSAMPGFKALELCPQGIFTPPDMKLYCEYSEKVMAILDDFSPYVIQLSIDEACLDMTGTRRLFGDPVKAAEALKQRVKDETGLTISIGIASNAYLAKICSDIKKPDGLYRINPGEEEEFMENLPLKKVWGIGEKTLERLNSCGLRTTKDIKSHTFPFLESIFGSACASFLYNVVRAQEPENFHSEPKSHSLSSETTFEYDISDRYTLETYLMQLSADVMERLLSENKTSLTVQIKIRYEDFTTVNAQATFETPLLCTDDIYKRALALFEKKYEFERGVRLLGVGVQNVINSNQIIQNELFENENIKKQTVEKAILDLESKHPKIKVHKARLLSAKTVAVFFLLSLIFSKVLDAQEIDFSKNVRPGTSTTVPSGAATITDEKKLPPQKKSEGFSLFNYTQNDKNIELNAEGFWNVNLTGTLNATFGYGKDFTMSFGTPVFEQEVDMSLWFLLDNHWYIQGAFADKFEKNTYAAGYYSDGVIKSFKVSNRNIIFPEKYSLSDINRSIGGSDNEAPGVSINMSDKKWSFDAALRYDMLSQQDKTYYGKNAVTNLKIPLENYLTGHSFVLPDSQSVSRIVNIYVESSSGNYTDEARRTYKKISSNDYLLLPFQNQVMLSQEVRSEKTKKTSPCVLIEFDSDAESVLTSLGNFGTPDAPGSSTGFLGKIQRFFGSSLDSSNIPLVSSYSYGKKVNHTSVPDFSGNETGGFFVQLNGKKMLLVQNSTGFSPFACSYRYDGGTAAVNDVQIASSETENKSKKYSAVIADTVNLVKKDFFASKRTYVDAYNPDYVISLSGTDPDRITYSSPEVNFPFADSNPGIYLGFGSQSDDCVMLKSFTASSRIDIGTKAVSGTVRVYKNGILDSGAKYNANTGEITVSSGISDTDKIYITWYEDSKDFETGMVSFASGFKYDFRDNLTGDVALATRWALAPDLKYAEEDRSSNGYLTLSTGIKWAEEKLTVSNVAAATLEIENVTGIYKIAGMDEAEPSTTYLIQSAAKDLPGDFAPFINPRPADAFSNPGLSEPVSLETDCDCSVSAVSGSKDSGISGYAAGISYNFSSAPSSSDGKKYWASTAVYLGGAKSSLSNASKFSLAVKLTPELKALLEDSSVSPEIYLQLGVSAETDFKIENKGNIPTWKIFDSSVNNTSANLQDVESHINTNEDNWQTVTVILSDHDRAFINENYNARIIITVSKKSAVSDANNGTLYAGPFEAVSKGIYSNADSNFSVSTTQIKTYSSSLSKLNNDTNYSQLVTWNTQNVSRITNPKITLCKYFSEVDISTYKTINLYFSYNVLDTGSAPGPLVSDDDIPLEIILDRNAPGADENGEIAVDLKINSDQLKQYITHDGIISPNGNVSGSIHHLEINRFSREVKIDGQKISGCTVYVNPNVIPVRLKVKVDSVAKTQDNDTSLLYPSGEFLLDELYLSDSCPKVILQDQVKTEFRQPGDIVTIKDFSLIKDASIKANADVISTVYTDTDFTNKTGFSGNADAAVTLATLRITNSIGRSSESKHNITSAGHSVSTTQPLLGFLSLSEEFNENKDDKTAAKANSAALNFNRYKIPLELRAQTKISSDPWSLTHNINDSLNFSCGTDFKYSLIVNAAASQNINSYSSDSPSIDTSDYFNAYADSYREQFSIGNPSASKRNTSLIINNTLSTPFASFAPRVNFSQGSTYTSGTQNLFSDMTQFEFVFPFKVGDQNLSFTYAKTGSNIENVVKGGTYLSDIEKMCSSMTERSYFFTSLPFYDLFSNDLARKVHDTCPHSSASIPLLDDEVSQSSSYNALYEFAWRRPLSASKYDLFVPVIATLSFARDISAAENLTDTYQVKSTLGYTSVNIFSRDGAYPIFKWCKSDEYNLSLNAALKFAKDNPDEVYQQYSTYLQANFYKTDEDVIRSAVQFMFQDTSNWNAKATIQYTRKSSFSPLLEFIKLFNDEFDYSSLKLLRTDSLNFNAISNLANSTDAKKRQYQSIEFNHLIEIQITKQISINTSLASEFTHTRDEICTLGFSAGIGGRLTF
ncbi:DNA polymerase IV [Treponema sp.]|uniref:DNA polymerase IV n=1 Tax=Treponema sp. TaxID=166 RepID=UPI00388D10FB